MVKEVVLIVTGEDLSSERYSPAGRHLAAIIDHLKVKERVDEVIVVNSYARAYHVFRSNQAVASIIVDWDIKGSVRAANYAQGPDHIEAEVDAAHTFHLYARNGPQARRVPAVERLQKRHDDTGVALLSATSNHVEDNEITKERLVDLLALDNRHLPIFLWTAEPLPVIPPKIRPHINEFLWKLEDTPSFVATRIRKNVDDYHAKMLPPFFKGLKDYKTEAKYSWHTPGHMGGVALLKSPPGSAFFNFFGEPLFRADLSVSVPEMGSLLDHNGLVGKAEELAARTFNADRTYFVTNGTSSGNKIVYDACVAPNDRVLIDRNCHKSIIHGTVLRSADPEYVHPVRNTRAIIGPVPLEEFLAVRGNDESTGKIQLTVLTNSTYDGVCYNVRAVIEALNGKSANVLFDEAWFPHARFNSLYDGRYAMSLNVTDQKPTIPVYSTQSSHKLLTALSQGSMVHVCDSHHDVHHFNESFMMHTSTSPQYAIIASLDVCTAMMDQSGVRLINDVLLEALVFRKHIIDVHAQAPAGDWWFGVWQSPDLFTAKETEATKGLKYLEQYAEPEHWVLQPGAAWHGFSKLTDNFCLLDPVKVTILTPGVVDDAKDDQNKLSATGGIPAGIVSKFLRGERIVVEKTDFYSFLVIFSVAITKGKSATLISALLEFKNKYDNGVKMSDVFPDVVTLPNETLKQYCDRMHKFYHDEKILNILHGVYEKPYPEKAILPNTAYTHIIRKTVQEVPLTEARNRINAVAVAPFPPGIPLLMPGERITESLQSYLGVLERFDQQFPGFEAELHGVLRDPVTHSYKLYCVPE